MKKIGFYLYLVFAWLFHLLPKRGIYIIADFIYFILFYVVKYRREVVIENLKNSFPEKSKKEISDIARKFFLHLSDMIVENIYILFLSKKGFNKLCVHKNRELLNKYYEQGRSVIVSMGHYGNWETLINVVFGLSHYPCVIYKPLNNKYFDDLYKKYRTKFGGEVFSIFEVFRRMIALNREKKLTAVYFVSDQTPHENKISYWTQFLNQETGVFKGIEKISKKLDQPVLFAEVDKVRRGRYEITYSTLVEKPKETEENEITEIYLKRLESTIEKKPELWLWSHKRWKYKRKQEQKVEV